MRWPLVEVAPPPSSPPEPPPREAHGRFLRGLVLGASAGAASLRDENRHRRFGTPLLLRVGYVFGRNDRHPDLRASIELRPGLTRVAPARPAAYRRLVQVMAETRIGYTRGPVWIYGIAGLGSGYFARRYSRTTYRDPASLLGTVGVGTAVRLTRLLAIHVDAAATGTLERKGWIGADAGLSFYLDLPRKERKR